MLGALAFYSPVPGAPTGEQLARLKAAASLTGLAVERGRAEDALREQRLREIELEQQLHQAAKMEALGVLAGGVAHDFNNILAAILLNAEFVKQLVPDNSQAQESLTDIIGVSERAGQFCQQMLAYAGRTSLAKSRVEIGALLPELKGLVQAAVPRKTRLEFKLPGTPVYVEGDENQLLQVILNLITNAADAIGDVDGSIVVRADTADYSSSALLGMVPHAELPSGNYLRLQVSDTGPGMSSETAARIFDPFFSTKGAGRGLGLSAVQGIVAGHGGAIHVDSEVGGGTTFTVWLPTTAAPEAAEPATETAGRADVPLRILVAEDERAVRSILARILKYRGFEVFEASDGQVAIDIFREHGDSIDCVLLDFNMPERDGEEVERAIRAMRADVPVLLHQWIHRR